MVKARIVAAEGRVEQQKLNRTASPMGAVRLSFGVQLDLRLFSLNG